MTYAEAMNRYGSDKPDTRYGFEFVNITELIEKCGFKVFADCSEEGKSVRGINVDGMVQRISKKRDFAFGRLQKHTKLKVCLDENN